MYLGMKNDGSRNPLHKARPDRFGRKLLYKIVYDAYGSVAQICLPKGQIVTGEYYATSCLAAVEQHYKERPHVPSVKACKFFTIMLGSIKLSEG